MGFFRMWNRWAGAFGVALIWVIVTGTMAQGQAQPGNPPQDKTGEGQTKENPDSPGEPKKEDSANPVQAVEDKTKEAVDMTKNAATAGILKARDWESNRFAGIFVGRNRPLVTLTTKQREEIYLSQTLTTPEAYVKRMFGALIDQARGTPDWQGGIGGYGERWASREGQFITANSLAALGNAELGYEVRYDRCKCAGKGRLWHAIERNFLTYNRTERELRPQWALYGGAFSGGVLATTWKPGEQSYLKNGAYGMLGQAAYGTLLNLVTEFAAEINRKQGVK
jgi:hypothetical protein